QSDQSTVVRKEIPNGRQHFFKRNKGEIHDDERIVIERKNAGLEMAGICFFQVGDAGILDQFVVHLGTTDIDAGCADAAALEAAVGKAAGGSADIQVAQTANIDFELVEKAFQFFPAAADKTRGRFNLEGRVLG